MPRTVAVKYDQARSMDKEKTVIRHIVMWKLKEHAEGATRAENALKLKEKLEGCRSIVPGIVHLEAGLAKPGLESTYDVVLVSDFTDKAALDAYQTHPTHEALKAFVGKVRESRECVDYEV
jgi:hypothetical protein